MTKYASVELDEHHHINEFDRGVPILNNWLTTQAIRANVRHR